MLLDHLKFNLKKVEEAIINWDKQMKSTGKVLEIEDSGKSQPRWKVFKAKEELRNALSKFHDEVSCLNDHITVNCRVILESLEKALQSFQPEADHKED